ncbi:MAG TPA: ATP-dependent helicase [Candidatus Paceibacterota bacterium]|nr:ATP-dependent helicase [Candidatus Paceibacterota bacterium]
MPEEILNSDASKICVIAAPGSGKTKRILIPKTAQILSDPNVRPKDVLLLSFSRLSAKDLKERVASMGDRAPRASTVHSICLAFLLSENDHDMRSRIESVLLDFEKNALLWDLKLIFPRISKPDLKNHLDAFSAGWATQPHDQVFEEDDFKRGFKAAVVNWLSEHEAAMMEEIVYGAVALARRLGTADFIREPRYILVDEYQDLNLLEQEFVNLLAVESDLLLVVGDPNQSIYGFKFSHPTGITDFANQADVRSWNSLITGRCPGPVVAVANQLIRQANPTAPLLQALRPDEGEVHFVMKQTQLEEFEYVARSIAQRLSSGAQPSDTLVLVPKKKLGKEFVDYINAHKSELGFDENQKVVFESKMQLTEIEQERILLFGLFVKPDSLLRARVYLGLGDERMMARELKTVKEKYGNLRNALQNAKSEDFPARSRRVRQLCERIAHLKTLLPPEEDDQPIDSVINTLFPENNEELASIRGVLAELREEDDSLESLYTKFTDHLRAVPTDNATVRVMTIMASKGLEAPHVYMMGCNSGNIPGTNRSTHMTDHEFREEQRRFLFVGITRASMSLTISWARHIPFGQSRQHHTRGIGFRRQQGQPEAVVGLSPFLRDITGITWEN